MTADPAFIKEAEKLQYTLAPTTGEQLAKIVKRVYDSSPAAIERAGQLRNQAR
jgi:hypothetical protein